MAQPGCPMRRAARFACRPGGRGPRPSAGCTSRPGYGGPCLEPLGRLAVATRSVAPRAAGACLRPACSHCPRFPPACPKLHHATKAALPFGVRRQAPSGAPSPLWIVDHAPADAGCKYLERPYRRPSSLGIEDPVVWQAKAAKAPFGLVAALHRLRSVLARGLLLHVPTARGFRQPAPNSITQRKREARGVRR